MHNVILRTGHEHASGLVKTTMLTLRSLMAKHPIAFYELVCKSRDRDHLLFGNTAETLSKFGLLEPNCRIHGAIREIVLAAVDGEGLNTTLRSPIEESPTPTANEETDRTQEENPK